MMNRADVEYICPMHSQVRQPQPGHCLTCGMQLIANNLGESTNYKRPLKYAAATTLIMLAVYFGTLSLVSGWDFAVSEFSRYWYFIAALAAGFGVQVGFYTRLRQLLEYRHGGVVLATSGSTSTAVMISCCSHYLVNVLPVIGAAGIVTLVAQYQVELFWLGLAFNAAGIAFIGNRLYHATRHT